MSEQHVRVQDEDEGGEVHRKKRERESSNNNNNWKRLQVVATVTLGLERHSGEMTRFAHLCKGAAAQAEAEAAFNIG